MLVPITILILSANALPAIEPLFTTDVGTVHFDPVLAPTGHIALNEAPAGRFPNNGKLYKNQVGDVYFEPLGYKSRWLTLPNGQIERNLEPVAKTNPLEVARLYHNIYYPEKVPLSQVPKDKFPPLRYLGDEPQIMRAPDGTFYRNFNGKASVWTRKQDGSFVRINFPREAVMQAEMDHLKVAQLDHFNAPRFENQKPGPQTWIEMHDMSVQNPQSQPSQ
jgi:hypothetical protein